MANDPAAHGKLLVEFIPADLCQIISAGVKEHGVDQAVRALDRKRFAGTDLFVEFKKTGLIIVGRVLRKARADLGLVAEKLDDLLICADSECAHQNSDSDLPGPVYTDIKNIVRVRLILQPCAPVGDHRAGKELLAVLIITDPVINAGGTDQLADDNTLSPVDDKCSVLGHQREISHKDLLRLDYTVVFLIIKMNKYLQGSRIGAVALFALFDGILCVLLIEPVARKRKAQMSAVVLDRRNVVQHLPETLLAKPLIGVLLNFDQIRHRQDFLLSLVAHTDVSATACRMYPVFFHQIYPVKSTLSAAA